MKKASQKVSISLSAGDLAALRKHAKLRHGGNLSAAVGSLVRYARYEDGADELSRWIGAEGKPSPAEAAAIRAEWSAPLPAPPTRRRTRAAA